MAMIVDELAQVNVLTDLCNLEHLGTHPHSFAMMPGSIERVL